MPFRRTLIGSGVGAAAGALLGGGLGAASTSDHDEKNRRAIFGALLGGFGGANLGQLIHGGLRTKQLRDLGYYPELNLLDPMTRGSKATGSEREFLRNLHAAREGFGGTKTIKQMKTENPFLGVTPSKVKGAYRDLARELHPDRGGSESSFKKMHEQFERFKVWHPEKKASAVFWESFSDELSKVAAKRPTTLKVPKPGTNLKGMERYTANPGKTPITEPGKENASAASISGLGRSNDTVGRSATSANPTPPPPLVS